MNLILGWLTGSLGPWIMGVVALMLVGSLGFAGIQTARLHYERGQTQKVQGKLDACVTNYNALGKVVKGQNAAMKAKSDADAKTLDSSRTVTAVTLKRQPKVDAKVKHVTQKPTGPTLLDRYENVDKHVLEAIR